jgi:hypothetical protein
MAAMRRKRTKAEVAATTSRTKLSITGMEDNPGCSLPSDSAGAASGIVSPSAGSASRKRVRRIVNTRATAEHPQRHIDPPYQGPRKTVQGFPDLRDRAASTREVRDPERS